MTLPVALSGSDVIGQAKTGTGKTLGFGLPLLERVTVPADVESGRAKPEQLTDAPQALVVVPTRELCQQVTNDLLTAGKVRNVRVLAIYGGRAYEPQVEALNKGVDVVVGTPGRLLDLAGQKKLNLSQVRALVLDEADEMLDLGFLPDVEKIIQQLPVKRQTMLFSATMPGQVISLARRYMSQPTHISATSPDDEGATVANITQHVFRAHSMDKPEMVSRILQAEGRGLAMIFCRTKRTAADIADQLARRGFASGAVHGDLGQGAREQALRAFRNGKVDVLVCTDVAARGIDVEGVTHVINYQSPEEEKTYLHRIGRTGRAGNKGTAVTLVDWDDIPRWQLINKALDLPFNDPEETYSTSAHLYELLKIPEGTKGVLPRSERTRAGLAAEEVEDLGETGGRGRGPRKGGREREEERPERTRTPRKRRRTRNGAPVEAGAEGGADAPKHGEAAEAAADTAEGTSAPRQLRRRRRTRSGASAATSAATTAPAATAHAVAEPEPAPAEKAPAEKAANAVDTAEGTDAANVPAQGAGPDTAQEAPAKPRRRRSRNARTQGTAAEAVAAPAEDRAPAAKAPARAKTPAPRRPVVVKEDTSVGFQTVEVAARRLAAERRAAEDAAKKTAERATAEKAVAESAPAEAAEEAPAKPRRARKTAAQKIAERAEAAVDAAEGNQPAETAADEAPAKPRRTRKTAAKKTTAKAEAAVEAAEGADVAEETPAKPRRTRKTAAKKAEAAVDTAEGSRPAETAADEAPAKPRRTRKTAAKKTAEKAEAATGDGATDEVPAKPRRTRKTAAKKTAAAAEAASEG
ncbi:DEAD/DEAH box helicase [Streptomyces sp. CA-132043]|uniref:DEAD/DEAH box helicase n=1 Tax=Streptomyces sp. CA-132043 TaxID=3240048 RepID=UPI003D8E584D